MVINFLLEVYLVVNPFCLLSLVFIETAIGCVECDFLDARKCFFEQLPVLTRALSPNDVTFCLCHTNWSRYLSLLSQVAKVIDIKSRSPSLYLAEWKPTRCIFCFCGACEAYTTGIIFYAVREWIWKWKKVIRHTKSALLTNAVNEGREKSTTWWNIDTCQKSVYFDE